MYDLIVVGGGAAGYFGAVSAAEAATRPLRIAILEQSKRTLQKVRISGGGRCNVTHAEFDPTQLVQHYPRGGRELLGPFTKFAPGDTMAWFEDRAVPLKIEEDGRVFPESDSSESIIDALQGAAKAHAIEVLLQHKVTDLQPVDEAWQLLCANGRRLSAKQVLLASGSAPSLLAVLAKLAIELVDPVPSLFTFKVPLPALHELKGLSVTEGRIILKDFGIETHGPILITHWGLSGPAVLRASAEAARALYGCGYKTSFGVSWTYNSPSETADYLDLVKRESGKLAVRSGLQLGLPKRLWDYLLHRAKVDPQRKWAELTRTQLNSLTDVLCNDSYTMVGKTTFKEEFVTAGGIELRAIDFRSYAVRGYEGLYAAGELLNIDGVTGGFNFQAAWTGGYLAGQAIASASA